MADCTGLENRRGETHREFESPPLRFCFSGFRNRCGGNGLRVGVFFARSHGVLAPVPFVRGENFFDHNRGCKNRVCLRCHLLPVRLIGLLNSSRLRLRKFSRGSVILWR